MSQVNDLHHAEDEGKAAGEEKKETPVRNAVKGLRDQEIHKVTFGDGMMANESGTAIIRSLFFVKRKTRPN